MASNEVNLKIRITDDNTLEIVGKKAKKAAAETEKLGRATDNTNRSRNNYNKTEKGVGQLTNNSTKAFSKQAGAINNGLVPAYATLAANVFAISAAFNVLSRAAEVRTLEEGFTRLGNTVGQTASLIAQSIVSITDGAVSIDEALRSAAAGFSAGFSTAEITGLAEVAKNASIALGRDLGDSLSRLTRGVAKLEPEILDELGIFIRLDDAAEKYAQQLGVAASSLTVTQRRQAFLNEALAQGQRKFAAVAGSVDPNPFNQLAASFQNLTQTLLTFVNVALGPMINLLAGNTVALVGVLTLFGTTVAKAALPGLTQLSEKSRDLSEQQLKVAESSAKSAAAQVKASQKAVQSVNLLGKSTGFGALQKKISKGKASTEELQKAIKSLQVSETRRAKNLEAEHVKDRARKEEELNSIRQLRAETEKLLSAKEGTLKRQIQAKGAERTARTEGRLADSIEDISMGGPIEGFKKAQEEMKRYNSRTKATMRSNGQFTKGLSGFTNILKNFPFYLKAASAGVRLFGAALINAIPFIGQIIFGLGLLLEGAIALAGKINLTSEAVKNFRAVTENLDKKVKQLNETNENLYENFLAAEGSALLLTDKLYETSEAAAEAAIEQLKTAQATAALNAKVQEIQNTYKVAAGVTDEFVTALTSFNKELATSEPGLLLTIGVALKSIFNTGLQAVINGVGGAVEYVSGKFDAFKTSIVEFMSGALEEFRTRFPAAAEFIGIVGTSVGNVVDDVQSGVGNLISSVAEGVDNALSSVKTAVEGMQENARKETFITELTNRIDELQEKAKGNDALNNILTGFLASIGGKDGLRAALETAIEQTGSLDEAMAVITARLANASRQVNATSDGLNNFGEQFTQTQQTAQKFLQTFEKQNPFTDLKRDISGAVTTLQQMSTAAKATNEITFAELIEKEAPQLESVFKTLGMSLEDLKSLGPTALDGLLEDVTEAYTLHETLKNRVDEAKAAVKELGAAFQFNKAKQELDRVVKLIKNGQELSFSNQFLDDGINRLKSDFELRRKFIRDEAELKKKVIDEEIKLQQKILEIRLKMAGLSPEQEAEVQTLISSLNDVTEARKEAIETDANTQILETTNKFLKDQVSLRKQIVSEIGDENQSIFARARLAGETDFSVTDEAGKVLDSGLTEKIAAMKELTSGMVQDLAKLGPDGEVAAAIATAGFTIAESFDQMFDVFGEEGATKMEKFGAAAAAVASSIGAVNSILQQQAQASIAKIDEQIAAEQKRDGKSKESVAKLNELEKRKEKIARKAFEMNKKMMIAQAIASTAAGVVGALGSKPWTPFNFAMAALVGAMGAAQVAIISSQSFQGGSGGGSSSGPSSISLGARKNSVDLARSQSARGELAYFRGESGIGGPENFKNAFAGYKNRAEGGNTAYMVGEQGPELFVPEMPGRIVANDDIAPAAPTNVSFNINTVDATGVEDLLVAQRGNIIGMIRQAANSYGQDFVEDVDTSVFTQSAGGVSRY